MNNTTRRKWAVRMALSAVAGVVFGLAGVGAFAWSCERQSESYDLSKLSNVPDRVRLADIPQAIVQKAAQQDDLIPSQILAESEFGLTGNNLRTRVVRKMVAGLIDQKFSPREVAEFYFNCVSPGTAQLHRLARHEHVEPEITPVSFTPPPPPEMTPLPPADEPPIQVRRAIAVPVRRALPVNASPEVTYRVAALDR